jgi:predicted phosphodiesterase
MIIQEMSDLHFGWHRDSGVSFIKSLKPEGVDVLILAGDCVDSYFKHADRIKEMARLYPNVIYVLGNHEFYDRSPEQTFEKFRKLEEEIRAEGRNFWLLDNQSVEIGGVRFHGSTLWFPKKHDNWQYKGLMRDFYVIHKFTPWVYEHHERSLTYLEENVRQGDIVVTHHLPSELVTAPRWVGNKLNRFFVGDAEVVLYDNKPKMWFFGHTHDPIDVRVGDTRCVCNAFGYLGSERPEMNFDFVKTYQIDTP